MAKKTARSKNLAGSQVARHWLFERLERWIAEDRSWAAVLVGPPGVGKSEFLRELTARHAHSILVDVRRPLGTHRQEGFWSALLGQTDLEGKKLPVPAYEASRWAHEHLPLDGRATRLVVVDSLDRAQDLLDGSGLAGLDRPIPGVRLIIASRPTHDLTGLERSGARIFRLKQEDPDNLKDVESYLSERLREMGRSQTALPRLSRLAGGNFLVARLVAEAFSERLLDHQDLHSQSFDLPALDRAMAGLWDEVVSLAPAGVTQEEMARVACCLCEAGEPLPAFSLADFLALSASRVNMLLKALHPLLCEEDGRIRLFHRAMSHLLARLFQRDLVSIHRGVVAYFREAFPSWEEMTDPYGWRFLGHHCDRLARTARRVDFSVLHWLGEGPYLRAKLKNTRSLRAVLDDLHRCLRAALEEVDLPRIIHYGLSIPRLISEEAAPGLHEMADLGELELAHERAGLLGDERLRLFGFLLLAWQSWNESKPELVERFLQEALAVPRPRLVEEDLPLLLSIVADLAGHDREKAFTLLDREEEPLKAVSYALKLGQNQRLSDELRLAALEQGWVWSSRVEDAEDRESARRSLAHEKSRVGSNGVPPRLVGRDLAPLEELLGAGFDEKQFPRALEILSGLRWETRKGIALGAVAAALAREAHQGAGWPKEAYLQLSQVAVQLVSPEERCKALVRMIQSLAEAGRRPYSLELVERFAAVAETLEDYHLRSRAHAVLGTCLHRLRDFRNSNLRFSESARLAFLVEDRDLKARALSFVAGCVAETGDQNRARDLAFNSLQASCEPPAERQDQNTRVSLAVGLVSSGHEYSTSMMHVAAQTATQTVEPATRATALIAVSRGMYRLGEIDWARKLFEQALGAARAVGPGAAQAVTLAELAGHCVETGDLPRAEKVLQESLETLQRESRPGHKAEGHLAAARALHSIGNEAGERFQIDQAFGCLDQLAPLELAMAPALQQIVRLGQRARALLERAMQAVAASDPVSREEIVLALLRAQLIMGEREAADELLALVKRSDNRCRALTEMARFLICEEPGDAVDYLRRIDLNRERMQAVRQCVVELSSEMRPSRQLSARQTLVELTLLSVDDEETADLVLSRWTYYAPNMMTILETMRKMGWSLEEPAPVGAGSVQLRGR